MKIVDSFALKASRETVWDALNEPDIIGPCMPGCYKLEILGPTLYRVHVRTSVGLVKAKFKLIVETTQATPPEEIVTITQGEAGTKASRVRAESTMRLVAIDAQNTQLHYTTDVSVAGTFGMFGLGFMRKKAKALGQEFIQNFAKKIEVQENQE